MTTQNKKNFDPREKSINPAEQRRTILLWVGVGFFVLANLVAKFVFPEHLWITIVTLVGLFICLGTLLYLNQKALKTRTAAFGIHSAITALLVLSIVGVLNFLVARYPQKLDLTKNKIHTLSDQTAKIVKGLKTEVKAVYFGKINQKDEVEPLLNNLKDLSPKFTVEYVDPDKEVTRAKQIGIKKYGTIQLIAGEKDIKLEEINEEKITNALIKILKDKAQTVCAVSGHGEKSFEGPQASAAEGFEAAKKALENQSYIVKEINLLQEGKIADDCSVIVVMGPTKAFFEKEIETLRAYFANGGRGIIALDMNVKGEEFSPELLKLLEEWHVIAKNNLIIDPSFQMLGVDAAVPMIATYSKEHPITKEMQGNCLFPLTRPLEIKANAPSELKLTGLAQTTPNSWAESDLVMLAKGQVKKDSSDPSGPHHVAIAVEGKQKDSQASQNTRIVVFGTSAFAANSYSRHGLNLDFFLNSASWTLEDDSLISIRAKEDAPSKIELSQKQGSFIFLLTVIILPVLIAGAGILFWVIRKRL